MAETARCSHSPRYILAAVSIKIWTADYGLGIKHGLGKKRGLCIKRVLRITDWI